MLKHLRKNPIALLALFISLGGTSFAAGSIIVPPDSVGTKQVRDGSLLAADLAPGQMQREPTYASIFYYRHAGPYVEVDKAANLTKDNVIVASDNTVCLDGLKDEPRNVQVTASNWFHLATVAVRPVNGLCAGKQVRISFRDADGSQPNYSSFFVSVQS